MHKKSVNGNANDGLSTKVDNKTVTLNNVKKAIDDVDSGKIDRHEACRYVQKYHS